uniref:Uncharacterized protein n=1 Tax=Meloidogyne enterolobii TaxID=390850 RepID=A0A6V7WUP7_MELEN|nr:unnamed protein product [Meloidogyne enterolobii]
MYLFYPTSIKFLLKVGDVVKVGNVVEKLEMYAQFGPLFCSDNGIFTGVEIIFDL